VPLADGPQQFAKVGTRNAIEMRRR
jgi:hypothetical protein